MIKKIEEKYRIFNGKYSIHAIVDVGTGLITLESSLRKWQFEKSKPETIKAIAELMIEAAHLVEPKKEPLTMEGFY